METILTTVLGILISDAVFGFVIWLVFFKQNRTIKGAEAKTAQEGAESAEIDNEFKKIDLGTKFVESSKQMVDMLKPILDGNRDDLKNDIAEVQRCVTKISEEQEHIVAYLDGPYNLWLAENYKTE